jgi:DNA invertase Pin-like site-specific DNA recombinase
VVIGYVRVFTDVQNLTAQRDRLHGLGVPNDRVYLDHGMTGTNRERPGLDQALAQSGGFGAGRLGAAVGNVTLFA